MCQGIENPVQSGATEVRTIQLHTMQGFILYIEQKVDFEAKCVKSNKVTERWIPFWAAGE